MKTVKCPNCGNDIVIDESNPELRCSCGKVYKNKYYVAPEALTEISPSQNVSSGVKIEHKSVGMAILLTFITCGIYGIVWFIKLTNDANAASRTSSTSGGMAFLFSLLTCGIYDLYWAYKQGEKLDTARKELGMSSESSSVLFLVLSIFGLGLIAMAIMQSQLNDIADHQ
ncbi:MAG: DUF4234 domain-containing protein [Lachnospiraceae bacterium]|nr:DUF4234 domain-containing protein [Lachnospiraceae bacterium]